MWPQVGPPMVCNPVPLVHYLGFCTLVSFKVEVACGRAKDTALGLARCAMMLSLHPVIG